MYQFQVLLDVSRHLVQLCTVEAYPAQVSHLNSLSCQSAILESGGVMSNEWWCESIIYIYLYYNLQVVAREVHSSYKRQDRRRGRHDDTVARIAK